MRELIIYWSPGSFSLDNESWNLLYSEPKSVLSSFYKNSEANSEMRVCPSIKHTLNNVFALHSNMDDYGTFDNVSLSDIAADPMSPLQINTKVAIRSPRRAAYPGFVNLHYNLGWYFVSEEPVIARMTSPYFPSTTPTPGAMLAPGEFDIGKWFRPFNLDYHVPVNAKDFTVKADDPLCFIEFQTDAKIVFKRFNLNNRMNNLASEMSQFSSRYGQFQKIEQKYKMAKNSKIMDTVITEIKKNLVD